MLEPPMGLFRYFQRTLLEMKFSFAPGKAIFYLIEQLKRTVLPNDWEEKLKYNLSAAERL